MVAITSPAFKENAARALADPGLQKALGTAKGAFLQRRAAAVANLPEFERLRDIGRDIKNHTLANLDFYLEAYEAKVLAAGGKVHWCSHPRRRPRRGAGDLPQGRRADRHQGQVDDLRGTRDQRTTWKPTASARSRPTSANTSCSSATSRRATSSPPPST